jgi:hypothetical protein
MMTPKKLEKLGRNALLISTLSFGMQNKQNNSHNIMHHGHTTIAALFCIKKIIAAGQYQELPFEVPA